MKPPALVLFAAVALLGAFAGCSHLDVAPAGDPNRAVSGTVNVHALLPAGAEVSIRVLDASTADPAATAFKPDLPVGDRVKPPVAIERVIGERTFTLPAATSDPVPYRVEFTADDDLLRHGLNVDARISYGGRVRYRMLSAHVVTPASIPFPQELWVDPVQ